jgi:hypothetical protein
MYIVQFLKKTQKPILLNSILHILFLVFSAILTNLKNFFSDEKQRLIYMTINQKNFTTGVRTSVHVLADCDVHKMTEKVMSDFNRFLNSNQSLELDSTFTIYFKVLSEVHVNYLKNRRRAIPIRHKTGCDNYPTRKPGSLVSLPDGYPENPVVFNELCTLRNLILGWLKFYNHDDYKLLFELTYAKRNNRLKNKAGKLLESLIDDVCAKTGLSKVGPHNVSEVMPLFEKFCNMQIHVVQAINLDGASIASYPRGNDYTKPRIYFYHDVKHLYLIQSIKTFCQVNKKGICFDCGLSYCIDHNNYHKCKALNLCYKCKGLLKSGEMVENPDEPIRYCDAKLVNSPLSCITCNQTFDGPRCFENHKQDCKRKKFGWKCVLCNNFVKSYKSVSEIKAEHVCGIVKKKCEFCFCAKELNHVCKINSQFEHKIWPNLAFLTMKFEAGASGNCNDCYKIKSTFATENKLNFKELFLHKKYKTLFCEQHLDCNYYADCNVINFFWESPERYKFKEFLFTDDNLHFEVANTLDFKYCETAKPQTFELYKGRRHTNNTDNIHCNYLRKKSGPTAIEKFFNFLFNHPVANTTFVVPTNKVMIQILKHLLQIFNKPDVVQKGRQIYVIEAPGLKCRFINFSHYIKGSIFQLGKQFEVPFTELFFPDSWNKKANYAYSGDVPPNGDFYLFDDSCTLRNQKGLFCTSLKSPWNFKEQLIEVARNDCKIFTNACLKFLKLTFDLQTKIAIFQKIPNANAIHAFGAQLCSISSFTMAIFKFYFYNKANYSMFSVMAPYNGTCTKSSKGEYEFMSYLCYKRPELKIRTAFNHPEGQKNFGKYFVDGYSAVSKTVFQYRGCRVIHYFLISIYHHPPPPNLETIKSRAHLIFLISRKYIIS